MGTIAKRNMDVAQTSTAEAVSVLEVIARAAADPTIDADKMIKLLEMQERFEAKQAERMFSEAMSRVQPRLPAITKNGMIAFKDQRTPFAKYEDIDAAIRPIICGEGFSVSFDSAIVDGKKEYSCKLSHRAGHSETKRMYLPDDTSGSKNAIQAVGSTISYAKRYLLQMHFNIITKNQDDDATAASCIGEREIEQIYDLFTACGMTTPESRKAFYKWAGVSKVEEIRADQYASVVQQLTQKQRQAREAK